MCSACLILFYIFIWWARVLHFLIHHHPQDRSLEEDAVRKPHMEQSDDFNDRVKDLEAKFGSKTNANAADKKPKVHM